ncbi:MAG TPA: gamma-glutamyltransferase, partial [Stellaceae bacterium]|nr:gamma-glutamyltransferase [Stellaceae bacterium]
MLETLRGHRGIVTAPHHLAAQAGLDVLKQGGNAVEAAVAVAATLAVVYPHMTGIGGDGFWLISRNGADPLAIDACGPAAAKAGPALYREAGHETIPWRGPLAALTIAGTVGGWAEALAVASGWGGKALALPALLEAAIHYAEAGYAASRSQADLTAMHRPDLAAQPGFAQAFMPDGAVPKEGQKLTLPALGRTLRHLGADGLDGYYRGALARTIAADLKHAGSPVSGSDLAGYRARRVKPLSSRAAGAKLFNMPPPTQGLASLMILALFDRLGVQRGEGFAHIHGLVEATKQAFLVRDAHVGDPGAMTVDPARFLDPADLDERAARIDMSRALPWPHKAQPGDTTWFGVIDGDGNAVSVIQSIFFEFGSGVVLGETGINWQ